MNVFYAWQGPNCGGRKFIYETLAQAAKAEGAQVDQDTRRELGAVDIPAVLLQKISSADMFVADVSLVYAQSRAGTTEDNTAAERLSPNPNVLVELGYAARALGWSRVVTVMDSATGQQEDLPFDIRHRRVVAFSLTGVGESERLTSLFSRAIAATKEEGSRPVEAWETVSAERLAKAAVDVARKAMERVELARRDLGVLARGGSLTYATESEAIIDYFVGRFVRTESAYASLAYGELVRRDPRGPQSDPFALKTVEDLERFARDLQLRAHRLSGPAH